MNELTEFQLFPSFITNFEFDIRIVKETSGREKEGARTTRRAERKEKKKQPATHTLLNEAIINNTHKKLYKFYMHIKFVNDQRLAHVNGFLMAITNDKKRLQMTRYT